MDTDSALGTRVTAEWPLRFHANLGPRTTGRVPDQVTDVRPIAWPTIRQRRDGKQGVRAVLLNLPWASWRRPSIQLGLLCALGRRQGHEVSAAHLNLNLAAELGTATYEIVCEHRSTALGEWLFARAAFGDAAPAPEPFLQQYAGPIEALFERKKQLLQLDALVAFREYGARAFLERILTETDWESVQLFGLSSTFQQNNTCFAMARLLKERYPGCVIVAGGANFDAQMGSEWLRCVPALDLVVSGEADDTFPKLLDALGAGRDLAAIPNLVYRGGSGQSDQVFRTATAGAFRELDTLPTPDYDEYFLRAERLNLLQGAARRQTDLPFETSRGCWWGERRHCTFCGLNGQTMSFRAKSALRVSEEMAEMAARYRSFRFTAVDNILDLKFHKTLLPELEGQGCSYDIFFEVKSGLSAERLRELHAAGIRRIQPGIESMSTHVLDLMDKGVSALANVNLLRWSAHLGLDVSWNIIWGFPEETQADYELQLQWLRRLSHLQPPVGAGRIWLERFSPLFQQRCKEGPAIQPERSLCLVYPAHVNLQEAAYFFEYDFESDVDPAIWQATLNQVEAWKVAWKGDASTSLVHHYAPGFLQIDESRLDHECGTYTFASPYAELYMALTERPRPVARLLDEAGGVSQQVLDLFLDEFGRAGLILLEGGQALALSLPARRYERNSVRSASGATKEPEAA